MVAIAASSCDPTPVTIRAGLLLDGLGGQARDVVITVANDRITSVAPWQGDSVTYDLSRYTILPGLIDAHVHISGYITREGRAGGVGEETPEAEAAGRAANALATLRAGFTTIASMGNWEDKDLRDKIAAGGLPGPRVLTSITQIRGPSLSIDSLRALVRFAHTSEADFIKIFASSSVQAGGLPVFTDQQLEALCGEARRLGLPAVVHAHGDASVRQAATAGCDRVEHGILAETEGLTVLAARGVYYDPQCGLVMDHYLEHWSWFRGMPGFADSSRHVLEEVRSILPSSVRKALAVPGLKMMYGSDAVAGAHGRNAEDLVCRVREAGQTPMDALVSATSLNAEALGLGDDIGRIARGYQADLIALDGDPLQEIEAVRRVRFVMKGGRVFVKP